VSDMYDESPPEIRRATEQMMAEVSEAGMDIAKVAAMEAGGVLSEHELTCIRIGIQSGLAGTLSWLQKRDMIKYG
jgi:hypothetical protein